MSDAPRPVNTESRRRTKKACLTCQRKKLKCNGLQPCAACSSRSNQCMYRDVSTDLTRKQPKHQHQQQSSLAQAPHFPPPLPQLPLPQIGTTNPIPNGSQVPNEHFLSRTPLAPHPAEEFQQQFPRPQINQYPTPSVIGASPELPASSNEGRYVKEIGAMSSRPAARLGENSGSNSDGNPGGESLKEQSRMLQDGKGRLLYLGDSASLSYLDTIRRLVESTLGPSDFTSDAHKHKILEGSISTGASPTHVLPDREAAEFLLDSFFSNTVGIIHIFDRESFGHEVAAIYENPLHTDQSRLSILNLVFAVGFQMTRSSTAHSFRESQILKRLDGGNINRAEMFYLNATHLNDPVSGFEDGDITSIQALLLITVFMLTVAKRNAAWAYFGMAVRSAYALGLHRKQTAFAFAVPEQRVRKNVWRSLYVMDCFLSAMLGRPNGIDNRDAINSFAGDDDDSDTPSTPSEDALELAALNASVRASRLIGDILSNVYAERKISVKLARAISNKFQAWKNSLPPILHWQNISLPDEDPRTTLAQLHVNLGYFHGIILLTRPFLLQKILNQIRAPRSSGGDFQPPQTSGNLETASANAEPFPGACVRSALYSIDAVQSALLKRALPRRDPFVIYWLFTAALIVFSNGFCTVYSDTDNSHAMQTALNLHRYLGEVDPLARRFLQILLAFDEAIARDTVSRVAPTTSKPDGKGIFSAFFGGAHKDGALAGVDGGSQTQTSSNGIQMGMPRGSNDWGVFPTQPGGVVAHEGVGQEMMQQIPAGADLTGISPSDYSLDFDAFLTSVSQEPAYQQDLWMPLYGTMDSI